MSAPAFLDSPPTESIGINPRHLSADTLSLALKTCDPGSARHRALLDEQRRRRENAARVRARQEVA